MPFLSDLFMSSLDLQLQQQGGVLGTHIVELVNQALPQLLAQWGYVPNVPVDVPKEVQDAGDFVLKAKVIDTNE